MSEIEDTLNRLVTIRKKPLCFIFKPAKSDDKISVHFYDVDTLELIKKLDFSKHKTTIGKISKSVKYSDGKWELKYTDYVPREYPHSVLLLQISNLRDDGNINLESGVEKYIPLELHGKWENSQVKTGNIVMAITATIGVSSLVPEQFPEANLNQALALIVLKESSIVDNEERKINKEYVVTYLNSKFGKAQLMRYGGFRAGQGGLSTAEIKSVLIPILSEKVQNEIVEQTKKHRTNAYASEMTYFEKAENMANLLENVLEEKMPQENHRTFVCPPDRIRDRIDCLYNSPDLRRLQDYLSKLETEKKVQLLKGKKLLAKNRKINKEIFEKRKAESFKYVDINKVNKEIGSIDDFKEDLLLKLPTRARQFIKENDVLVPAPIFSKKSIAIVPEEFDGQICTTGFFVIEASSLEEAVMYFGIFKSNIMLKQMYLVHSGSAQPNVSTSEFQNKILIPVPQGEWRTRFITQVKSDLSEAQILRKKQLEELQKSQKTFEKLVLESL